MNALKKLREALNSMTDAASEAAEAHRASADAARAAQRAAMHATVVSDRVSRFMDEVVAAQHVVDRRDKR